MTAVLPAAVTLTEQRDSSIKAKLMSVIVVYSIRERHPPTSQPPACLPYYAHPRPPPPPIYDRFFLAYPAVLQVSSFSELPLVPVDLSGGVIHRETFTRGREETTSSFFLSSRANAPVLFSGATVCTLSDWERQVCVWLSYHLRPLFASVSAD